MNKALKRQMKLNVTLEKYLGMDGTGESTYSAPITVRGFLQGEVTLVRTPTGEEVVSQQTLFLDETRATLGIKDRITLPSGQKPAIINISVLYDDRGRIDHLEVYL